MISKIYCLLILLSLTTCWEFQRVRIMNESSENYQSQEQYWFTQIVDHFNYFSSKTWQQRYYVYNNYFKNATGSVILYIGGEGQCRGISDTSFVAQIAQETNSLVISLQHRYYGQSKPFGNSSLTKQNLKYLSSEQALADMAYFISKISKSSLYKITEQNPWITIGGSYSGALSAWFRSKYPHLTIGAIGSSGVILAVEDFRQFDEQIYTSTQKSGDFCPQAITNLSNYVENQVTGDNKETFKAQFGAQELTAREFLFYWSDTIVFQVQYGSRVNFCNQLKGKTLEEQFNYVKGLAIKVTPYEYGSAYISNITFQLQKGVGARQWYYQSCTEFSYFQTYAADHPMRSRMLSIDFYRKWCEDSFGQGTWPYVKRVNNQFGGLSIVANNLIMTNGVEDPWQWASLRKSTSKDIYSKIINCQNCAHCVDLRAPSSHDSKDLTDTRAYEMQSVKKWIADYWKKVKIN